MPSISYMEQHWTLEELVDAHTTLDLYDQLDALANTTPVLP